MNCIKSVFVFSLVILTSCFSVFAQQDSIRLDSVVSKSIKFSNSRPPENVYLHFDKPYYAVGDTIWFKAYLTVYQHQPSPLSKIVYVDVITNKDSLVKTMMLPVNNSVASGSLPLPESTFREGNYYVRAYTRWMFNFGEESFFHKNLYIGNAFDKEILTHASFSGSSNGKTSKITARILYKNPDGSILAGKKVNWSVEQDFETIDKGKGTTDQNGYLTAEISGKPGLDSATLITTVDISNQKSVSRSFPLKSAVMGTDVQFFPEGGELIQGIPTQIGFKAIQSNGLGIDIKGTVTDNAGNVVSNFSSQHLGMGVFVLTPEKNKTYRANITFPDGSKKTLSLPQAKTEGINLSVNNTNAESLIIKITANDPFFAKNQNKGIYIIAQSGGVICYAAQTLLQKQVYTAVIPKNKFPSGIIQITLLSTVGDPLSERIAFISHPDALNIAVATDRKTYATRQKVKMDITAKNALQPTEGNFSVAVIDETKVPFDENNETTILSSLLLSSQLKGYIEKPNYYFNHTDAKKLADLDALMLTQGYRSFSYKDIITGNNPQISFLPEQGIEVTGTLRRRNGMPVFKGHVTLRVPDKNFSVSTITDANGRFKFSDLVFPDSSKVQISALNNIDANNLMLMLDGNAFPAVAKNINQADEIVNIDSVLKPYLQNSKKQYRSSHLLKEVVIEGKTINKPHYTEYSSLSTLSFPDHEIPGDRFKDCNFLLNCLQGQIPGLTYVDENFYVTRAYNAGSRIPVQIFVDGMAVDVNYLGSVNTAMIESIEVFLKDDLGLVNKTYRTNGVLAIYTRKPPKGTQISAQQLQQIIPKPYETSFTPLGYLKERQFYSPKYITAPKVMSADLRTTIYWNPDVITDKTGKSSFEFYNADGKGTYKAVVEGIDKDGNIGRAVYRYKVQ